MKVLRAVAVAIALAAPSSASAHGFTHGNITITHPFLRETPPTARNGAGCLVLTNVGSEADTLLAVETSAAREVQFHRTVIEDGIASMRPIENGFRIPAGEEVVIGEGGTHLMLVDLAQPIREGELVEATLIFEESGMLQMYFEVEPVRKVVNQHAVGGHGQ